MAGGPGVPQGTRKAVMTAADKELFLSAAKSCRQESDNGRDRHGRNAGHKWSLPMINFTDMPGGHASDLLIC